MNNIFENLNQETINYKDFLRIRTVEIDHTHKHDCRFSVSENFTVFVTSQMHEHLSNAYGVDPDRTLTEGYIIFNDDESIKRIIFKPAIYQPNPAFKGNPEELKNYKKPQKR